MGILLSKDTKVIVQGITGNEGRFWTRYMLDAGTKVVGGVTPGKKGEGVYGVSVYNTVADAAAASGAEASVIFVPPGFAKDAAFEALEVGLRLIVLLVDGLPVQDALEIRTYARECHSFVLGPNTPGIATVGEAMLGFVPVWLNDAYLPGCVGLVTRSGSLTNEVASHIVTAGYGVSSFVGLGGDSVPCTRLTEVLALFERDQGTAAVVVVGEVGGTMEEEAAEMIMAGNFTKPVIAFVAGRSAPPGKRMGHAGAIITMGRGSIKSKEQALGGAGALIACRPVEVEGLVKHVLRI